MKLVSFSLADGRIRPGALIEDGKLVVDLGAAGYGDTLAVIAAGAWLVWQRARQPRSGDIRKIVIADFDNRTGDEVFDFVLKNALEIDL